MMDDQLKRSVLAIEMPDDMRSRIIQNSFAAMGENPDCGAEPIHGTGKRLRKKTLALIAAIILCITISVPVLAANVPAVEQLLYAISPATAQFFKPVKRSCEDNGIKMEVVSAYIHGDTAEVYITMQDLTGQRIDETTDLFDSYSIHTPFDCAGHCQAAGYDEETRTATFFIKITQWEKQNIEGDKITFSVREFLSNKQRFDGLKLDVDVSSIGPAANLHILTEIRGEGGAYSERYQDRYVVLSPSDQPYSPVPGVSLTAMGYVDDALHVQVHYENILETDNHGFLYFQNAAGENIDSIDFVTFWDSEHRGSYYEYVFPVPKEGFNVYALYGDFVTSDSLTKGHWEVTFPIEGQR